MKATFLKERLGTLKAILYSNAVESMVLFINLSPVPMEGNAKEGFSSDGTASKSNLVL